MLITSTTPSLFIKWSYNALTHLAKFYILQLHRGDEPVFKNEKTVKAILSALFALSIACLSIPTMMALFFSITPLAFKIINTLGWILATIRIVISLSIAVAISASKTDSTKFKRDMDKETVILFFCVIVLQFVNFMFIQFG